MNLRTHLFAIAALFASTLHGSDYVFIEEGEVHEALLPKAGFVVPLLAVKEVPPQEIEEEPPPSPGDDYIFVPGYWSYSRERGDYIYISGVYRKPPPNHGWVKGSYRFFPEGWVRSPGFWSPEEPDPDLAIKKLPPQNLDETTGVAPGSDYYFAPGFFVYDREVDSFLWVVGRWDKLDPDFVFTPASYNYRPEGFYFVAPFWDYPLEERGVAYKNVYVKPGARSKFVLKEHAQIGKEALVYTAFLSYPDYNQVFKHHFYFNPGFYSSFPMAPDYWSWSSFWALPYEESWALFWWWSHPNTPQPSWLGEDLASSITPPSFVAVKLFQDVEPPLFITKKGAVSLSALFQALSRQDKGKSWYPFFPAKPELAKKVIASIEIKEPSEILLPSAMEKKKVERSRLEPKKPSFPERSLTAFGESKALGPIHLPPKGDEEIEEHEEEKTVYIRPALPERWRRQAVRPEYFVPRDHREPYTPGPHRRRVSEQERRQWRYPKEHTRGPRYPVGAVENPSAGRGVHTIRVRPANIDVYKGRS